MVREMQFGLLKLLQIVLAGTSYGNESGRAWALMVLRNARELVSIDVSLYTIKLVRNRVPNLFRLAYFIRGFELFPFMELLTSLRSIFRTGRGYDLAAQIKA